MAGPVCRRRPSGPSQERFKSPGFRGVGHSLDFPRAVSPSTLLGTVSSSNGLSNVTPTKKGGLVREGLKSGTSLQLEPSISGSIMPQGISIGGITLSLTSDVKGNLNIDPAYLPFTCADKPDINLRLHHGIFESPDGNKAFDCPPIWRLIRKGNMSIAEIFPDIPSLKRALVFESPLKEADLYLMGEVAEPFYGPTIELLMMNYLAQGYGIILHACGVARGDQGILFVGESGAGKSTMARIWAQERGVEVLSDDRTIVRRKEDPFGMYGTPWHGEGKFGSPGSAKVEKIFFLSHGEENSIREMRSIDAVSRLVACSFPPHWDPAGMAFTLGFISELTAQVICRELRFKADRSVIDFLNA
jgi:hypothetical protein